MKITNIEIGEVRVPLIKPFKTALRTVENVEDIMVRVTTEAGVHGYGEAAPTAVITGDTKASISSAVLDFIRPVLIGRDIFDLDGIFSVLDKCIQKNTSAKAAVDIAIYDAYAKTLAQPLYKLLGGNSKEIETDITISVNPVEQMVNDSLEAAARGFRILKVKVGKDGLKDIERISEIRKAIGKDIVIRVDANQGWTAKEAVKIISMLEERNLDIELVEQPVPAHDFEGLKYITDHVLTPILADESVFSAEDAIRLITERAADYINIKLMKTGGIHNALKICSIAETYGVKCMLGCMLEGKVSVSAAAHLGAAKGIISMADLDGPCLCSEDPFDGGALFDGHVIRLTDEAGTGVTGVPCFR